jgi:hypothetical protein
MKKTIFIVLFLILSIQNVYAERVTDRYKNKPKAKVCVETYKGQCIQKNQIKSGQFQVAGEKGDVFCENNEICVSGNGIDPVKTEKTDPANAPVISGEISDFCKDNPTRAELNSGTAKSKNSKIPLDSSVMSQEECQVWIKGTPEEYQKYVANNDPEVTKMYKESLEKIKSSKVITSESGVFANLDKEISQLSSQIAKQENNVAQKIKDVVAPPKNPNSPVNPNLNKPSLDQTAIGMNKEEYAKACKANNNIYSDTSFPYPLVSYAIGMSNCPAGYVEKGLQYSMSLGMRCCIKDQNYFNNCTSGGVVQYYSECSGRKTNVISVGADEGVVCCFPSINQTSSRTTIPPASNPNTTNPSSTNPNTTNPNLIQAPPTQTNTGTTTSYTSLEAFNAYCKQTSINEGNIPYQFADNGECPTNYSPRLEKYGIRLCCLVKPELKSQCSGGVIYENYGKPCNITNGKTDIVLGIANIETTLCCKK